MIGDAAVLHEFIIKKMVFFEIGSFEFGEESQKPIKHDVFIIFKALYGYKIC